MSRMVFCRKYQEELEGLLKPPFPGLAGQKIFEDVSKKAWQEWLKHQTLLINEKRLELFCPETQKYLAEQRELFLSNSDFEQAEGYVAPQATDVTSVEK